MVFDSSDACTFAWIPTKAIDEAKHKVLYNFVIIIVPFFFSVSYAYKIVNEKFHNELLKYLTTMVERELTAIQMSTRDEFTEISNRRAFMLLAQFEFVR